MIILICQRVFEYIFSNRIFFATILQPFVQLHEKPLLQPNKFVILSVDLYFGASLLSQRNNYAGIQQNLDTFIP
jgi:hypothetical protein